MNKPQSNQATPKYLGFVYQVLVALEQCFIADKNQTIWIECYGDIYNGKESIEIKHHLKDSGLASNAIDFWKTLKNIVVEDTDHIEKFVLHTTESIPSSSIFHDWNSTSKTKKYSALKKHIPCQTAKPYYDEAMKLPRTELIKVLDNLEIKTSKMKVKEFWDELSNSRYLKSIDEEYREDAVKWLHSHLNTKAIDNPYNWHININDFDEEFRIYTMKFKTGKIPFPSVSDKELDNYGATSFDFLKEFEELGIKRKVRVKAVSDYLRTNASELVLMKKRPTLMRESITKFESDVQERCNRHKDIEASDLEEKDLNSTVSNSASKKAYNSFHTSSMINIEHVDSGEDYFMFGKAHNAVESKVFTWKYNQEDVE
ncbi:hypothetical protein AB4082_00795 [Vibrio cyclitrophicus]